MQDSEPKIPDPPPLTPDQCVQLEKIGLWQNILTNFLYLLPAALCFSQKRYLEGISLAATAIFSTLHHNYDQVGSNTLLGTLDEISAIVSTVLLGRILLESVQKSGWNANAASACVLGVVAYFIFYKGSIARSNNKLVYLASHNTWHILTALAGFILLLPQPRK